MYKTLDDLKKDKKPDNKDKKNTDSYTGGTKSGMAVENPPEDNLSKNNNKEEFDKFEDKDKVKITLYKNGFKFNDGPFRSFDDENNKKFMKDLESGFVPQELVKQGYKDIAVAMEDHRKDDYVEPIPEKKFEAFVGSGSSMGQQKSEGLTINKDVKFEVDETKELAKISFRLHNGEMITQSFNMTHTVGDVYKFVEKSAPVIGSFKLVDGFPPKPLTEMGKSVKEAKLHGSCLTQRLD